MLPPPPSATFSRMSPANRGQWWGGSGLDLPMVIICRNQVRRVGGGFLPPESLLCPVRVGAKSESRGWYAFSSSPFCPPLLILWTRLIYLGRSYIAYCMVVVGLYPTGGPDPSCVEIGGIPPATFPPTLPYTLYNGPVPVSVPKRMVPSPTPIILLAYASS